MYAYQIYCIPKRNVSKYHIPFEESNDIPSLFYSTDIILSSYQDSFGSQFTQKINNVYIRKEIVQRSTLCELIPFQCKPIVIWTVSIIIALLRKHFSILININVKLLICRFHSMPRNDTLVTRLKVPTRDQSRQKNIPKYGRRMGWYWNWWARWWNPTYILCSRWRRLNISLCYADKRSKTLSDKRRYLHLYFIQ